MRYLSEARGVKTVGFIKFNYNGTELKFPRKKPVDSFRACCVDIYNWLYENNFDFSKIKNVYNNNGLFYSESEKEEIVNSGRYQSRYFAKIDNTDKYILAVGNISQFKETIENMLSILGCDSLVFEGFEPSDKIKKFKDKTEVDLTEEIDLSNVYCVRAGVANRDINLFLEGNFVGIGYDTRGFDIGSKTKEEINQFLLIKHESSKSSIPQFLQQIGVFKKIKKDDIVLVPDNEGTNIGRVISDIYLADDEHYPNRINVEWLEEKVGKNKSLYLPKSVFEVKNFDTDIMNFTGTEEESEEDEIIPFNRFGIPTDYKAVQAQEEKETKEYNLNPFRQSICVLGDSGAGKSTTLENILEAERHEFEFIIPSASTTGLLSQFSPSKSGYIKSRLGKMIVEAFNNPTTLYTAVFDECHKSNVIEMINDELLQAISTKRNMGKRFISLDEDTSELYKGVDTFRGNILIPDNFGFIFISSKPRIIANNTDFFNRVELVLLTESDRDMSTSDELLSKVLPEEEKMKLASTRND